MKRKECSTNMNKSIIDYNVFYQNLDFLKFLSKAPIEQLSQLLLSINSEKNNSMVSTLKNNNLDLIQNIPNALLNSDEKQNWAEYRLNMSIKVILSVLYAERNHYKFQIHGAHLLSPLKGNILFYPHYDSYMALIPILATNNIKLTIMMDGESIEFWNHILKQFDFRKNIKLHSIQNKNSLFKVAQDVKNGYNLIMFPEFSLGDTPKNTTYFLGEKILMPIGPVVLAKKLKTNLIPLKITYPKSQLLPYVHLCSPINLNESDYEAGTSMMNFMENIIIEDKTKWWAWEVFFEKMLIKDNLL